MTPYLIDGDDLESLLAAIEMGDFYSLRVAIDEDGVKFKFNNGSWSPALGAVDE